jgi:membrane protein required for colicin V production
LNKVDIILAIFFLIGAISGYRRGFLMALFSLLAIILGIIGAFKLMGMAMIALSEYYGIDNKVLPYVSFALVFVVITIVVSLIGKVLSTTLEKTVLGSVDNWMGAVLGILKAMFMISVFFWILEAIEMSFPSGWTEGSRLYSITSELAPSITSLIGQIFPFFSDTFGNF